MDSGKRSEASDYRKSSLSSAMDKAKSKLSRRPSGPEALPNDEQDFQRQKAKALEKQRRKEEYERLGLDDRMKFGLKGAGGFNSG